MSEHHLTAVDTRGMKTFKAYVVGFTLSLALTIIAFVLVGKQLLPARELYLALGALAVLQLLVQAIFFLRLNAGVEGRVDLWAFIFTVIVVLVVVFGSLWIMINLDYFMMN